MGILNQNIGKINNNWLTILIMMHNNILKIMTKVIRILKNKMRFLKRTKKMKLIIMNPRICKFRKINIILR